ncbi:MAG: cell division protein FtsE [marine bacterium B5-7]|nr:MAG: cell division protein FtsE [marine bacterium B5-7]
MIRFSQISKNYGGPKDALNRVTFHVTPGEMVFLTGHSGAGKSTLLKLILVMERASRGQIVVGGLNLGKLPRRHIARYRRGIGVVFQDNRLLADRSVGENVALPLMVSGVSHRDVGRRVRAALDKVGLLDRERVLPTELSGGEQQRVGIARAVVNKPSILLADEPTGNLDDDMASDIMDLFAEFNRHRVTVLIATHDLRQIGRFRPARQLTLTDGRLTGNSVMKSGSLSA